MEVRISIYLASGDGAKVVPDIGLIGFPAENPFLPLSEQLSATFKLIYPERVLLRRAPVTPPFDVLGFIVYMGYFKSCEIWYNPSPFDAVLIGDGAFLIAQWGNDTPAVQAKRGNRLGWVTQKLEDLRELI